MANLHSEALNPLRSLSCSRPSKLLDLKAESSGGPNRLSVADSVELNLEQKTKHQQRSDRQGGMLDGTWDMTGHVRQGKRSPGE